MTGEDIYLSVLQWFFMTSTAVFFLLSFLFFGRMRSLKGQVDAVCAELDFKNKELEKKETPEKELMVPFGSSTSKSIILSLNPAGEVTYLNTAAEELFGYERQDILGHKALGRLFPLPDPKETTPDLITRIFLNPRLYLECDTENIKKSGEKVFISWTNRVTYNKNGDAVELHCVGFDISRRKRLENNLKRVSLQDALTGVLNRQAFLSVGENERKRAVLYRRPLSVVTMKLAYFHNPSSNVASSFSDQTLQKVIGLCQKQMPFTDIFGRIDDVEFAVLLPETTIDKAEETALHLKKKVQEASLTLGAESFITVTVGTSQLGKKDILFDTLLMRAFNTPCHDKKCMTTSKTKKKG